MTDHQIIHGDACEILPTLDVKANLILTSPPYGDMRTFGGHGFDFDRMADTCVGVLAEGGVLVWQVGDYVADGSETCDPFRQVLGFRERGLKLHDTMIYRKINPLNHCENRYVQAFEYMFVLSNGTPATSNIISDRLSNWHGRKTHDSNVHHRPKDELRYNEQPRISYRNERYPRHNVWDYAVGGAAAGKASISAPDFPEAHEHPSIFPIALALDHITTWTNPGDLVLDPMAGSGTVSRAAKDLGRDSIAVEIHEPYVDLIKRRMAQEVLELA